MAQRRSGFAICAGACVAATFCAVAPASSQVVISTAATQNISCAGGVCAPTADGANLNVNDLETMLASGNLEITTIGSGVLVNDIQVMAGFSWSTANSLTLNAYHSVVVEEPVAVKGAAGVSLVTNVSGLGGALTFNPGGNLTFAGTTNVLSINGQPYVLENTLTALISAISQNPSGFYALSANDNARRQGVYGDSPIRKFSGSLNGLGNTITGLTIETTGGIRGHVGLFSLLHEATVSSLRLRNITIELSQRRPSIAVGAFAGEVDHGTLSNDYANGLITSQVTGVQSAGGLVGVVSKGKILDSGSSVSLNIPATVYIGGIAGTSDGMIEESYATGNIMTATGASSGGLVGSATEIDNCYATGSITTSNNSSVGGFAGETGNIAASYSMGTPRAGPPASDVGGFVGDGQGGGSLSNNYWDTTTSGITNLSQGAGNVPNDPGITGKTSKQLKSGLPKGFDPGTWAENARFNHGLPYLIANPPRD